MRNGVDIIVEPKLKDKVVEVKRKGDRIILLRLVLGDDTINVISAYAPQVGLNGATKDKFWEEMDEIMQGIPGDQQIFIGGDLNGHVGKDNNGYGKVHGGFGFGTRNEEGKSILDFVVAYDLVLANTCFKKRESHLITFKSGRTQSQIDFILTRRREKGKCKDCKVIPGEALTAQHRIVVLDLRTKSKWVKEKKAVEPRIRWW